MDQTAVMDERPTEAALSDDDTSQSEEQAIVSAVRGKASPPDSRPCGKKGWPLVCGKKIVPHGKKFVPRQYDSSTSDTDSDDDDMDPQEPTTRAVLSGPPKSKPKGKPAPHLRRLRVADIKKKPSEAQKKRMAADGIPAAKRARSAKGGVPEPDDVRSSDIKSLETHPVVLYLRCHTPVKPCGRCAECRKPPCGKCGSCKKNVHLTERSRARERCTANGCTKLTEEELDRYRRAYNSAYTVDVIETELRHIRSELMALQERGSCATAASAAELRRIQQKQANLISRLQALNDEDPVVIQQTPDGYECFLLSIQTLETERDRVARLIERRTCRDPPRIMSSRRQLRDFYGRKICNMTRLFATEMVARPYVQKLIEIADEHERLLDSFPQTEAE